MNAVLTPHRPFPGRVHTSEGLHEVLGVGTAYGSMTSMLSSWRPTSENARRVGQRPGMTPEEGRALDARPEPLVVPRLSHEVGR